MEKDELNHFAQTFLIVKNKVVLTDKYIYKKFTDSHIYIEYFIRVPIYA